MSELITAALYSCYCCCCCVGGWFCGCQRSRVNAR